MLFAVGQLIQMSPGQIGSQAEHHLAVWSPAVE